MAPPARYIAYIDEAGDDGLERVGSASSAGASEWWVISAVVIKAEREGEILGWGKEIVAALQQPQIQTLHFRKLSDEKKRILCKLISSKSLRLFVFMSHKKNMQGYRNVHAEAAKVNRTAWFYAWTSKILMESVTDFCGRKSRSQYREAQTIRMEFSDRGGVNIEDIRAYYKYIKDQALLGLSYNKDFPLDWSTIEPKEMFISPNSMRIGLQLSDAVASSFYASVSVTNGRMVTPDYATLLCPRIGQDRFGKKYMYGIKVMPRHVPTTLPAHQRQIFDFYRAL